MTDTSSLSHLIERLERATTADRELDGEIASVLALHPKDWQRDVKSASASLWFKGLHNWRAPDYTSSIDAAMTLLPDGVYWMAACGKRSVNEPLGACALYHPGVDQPFVQVEGHTVAIALCIAALKARLSTMTNEQDDARATRDGAD